MSKEDYRICTKTIMDTSDKKIDFNKKGESVYYTNFIENIAPNWHTDEKGYYALMRIAEKIRIDGKKRGFDCIIGLSGGLDSSSIAAVASKINNQRNK
jgi:asparagine synthetase B (glutamine-hydrolysing)